AGAVGAPPQAVRRPAASRRAGRRSGTASGYGEHPGQVGGHVRGSPRVAQVVPPSERPVRVSVLLLARHGQASFGAADYDVLSPLGHRQAGLLGKRLQPLDVARLVTGTLVRQQDTARGLGLAAPVETDPGWDEYDSLDVLSGVPPREVTDNASFQLLLDDALAVWVQGGTGYREPWPAFRDRVAGALDRALSGPGTTVVVASAGSIGVATAALLGLPDPGWTRLARVMVNTGLAKVVRGRSGTSLVSVNDHAHLEAEPGLVTYR
ncbi:MAG: histidine phosphatase family protein, partial [Frankiales bacterium]|nr:histidine phosphatase family protein [Frankiales bacterium]